MKRHFWLILAVLALIGMFIMPSTAHSAVIQIPKTLPGINAGRMVLPNYPLPLVSIGGPAIQLSAPQLQLNPGIVSVAVPSVQTADSALPAPAAFAAVPGLIAPDAPVAISIPKSAIPSSRIEGISVPQQSRKDIGAILSRLAQTKDGKGAASADKLAALFDGVSKPGPAAVTVEPVQASPVEASEDTSLTLPESDLADEIGLGY